MLAMRRGAVTFAGCLVLAACGAASDTGTGPGGGGGNNACTSGQTLALGQVVTGLTGSSICVAGGSAHQEFLLVPFFASTQDTITTTTSFSVSGTGVDSVSATVPANLGPLANLRPATIDGMSMDGLTPNRSFELGLRRIERRELPRLFASARAARAARAYPSGLSMTAIPGNVQVGTLVTLNANANSACSNPINKTAMVQAVSNKAIVVSDTSNPTGGFTAAQYQQVAAAFDTLVDPVDEGAFGAPSDVDGNGRVIIFYTRAVNELTPANSGGSYVGGFFFGRDLFPTTTDQVHHIQGCPASNFAEMFYMLAPDPLGVVNGNKFSTSQVFQITIGTTAHEFQHLINAARRLYVNTRASTFEYVWLNEGLSHIAEELMFYKESGLAPRQNVDATKIRASAASVSAFNNYQADNFGRYRSYLLSPSTFGPYVSNDSLETRGATWSMLRYLVDHHGSGDGQQWNQLVNSDTAGLQNLRNVFGSDVLNQIRDWSVSVYTDDVSFGVSSQWQQPSWNFRNIYPALSNHLPYALVFQTLPGGAASLPVTLAGSGSAYIRFATAANKNAQVAWAPAVAGGSLPPALQFSVVRIQ